MHAILETLGLRGLTVVADPSGIAALESSQGCLFRFPEALKAAICAFCSNASGSGSAGEDSPLGLILATPEAHGLVGDASAAAAAEVLTSYLKTDPEGEVVLLTAETLANERYRFRPEYGESTEENWVFRFRLPTKLDIMIWAVVDKTGARPAYAYCVE